MATTHAPASRLTNVALGQLIGLDHTSVSRLRRGERRCSTAVMIRIEELFDWPVRKQYAAINNGTFAEELEYRAAIFASNTTRPANHDTPVAS